MRTDGLLGRPLRGAILSRSSHAFRWTAEGTRALASARSERVRTQVTWATLPSPLFVAAARRTEAGPAAAAAAAGASAFAPLNIRFARNSTSPSPARMQQLTGSSQGSDSTARSSSAESASKASNLSSKVEPTSDPELGKRITQTLLAAARREANETGRHTDLVDVRIVHAMNGRDVESNSNKSRGTGSNVGGTGSFGAQALPGGSSFSSSSSSPSISSSSSSSSSPPTRPSHHFYVSSPSSSFSSHSSNSLESSSSSSYSYKISVPVGSGSLSTDGKDKKISSTSSTSSSTSSMIGNDHLRHPTPADSSSAPQLHPELDHQLPPSPPLPTLSMALPSRWRRPGPSSLRDRASSYVKLVKLRLSLTVLYSVTLSHALTFPMYGFSLTKLLSLHGGAFLCICAANAANQWMEAPLDAQMPRTRSRPLPSHRLSPTEAISASLTAGVLGGAWLYFAVNPVTAALGVANAMLYAFIYTPLKRLSTYNTHVGAVVGAIPPIMGFSAATGTLWTVAALPLAVYVFCWQFPHFYGLAFRYRDEYARAGFRMMPVLDPPKAAREGLYGAIGMLLSSYALVPLGLVGPSMYITATIVHAPLIWAAWMFISSGLSPIWARRMFLASVVDILVYFLLIGATLAIENWEALKGWMLGGAAGTAKKGIEP